MKTILINPPAPGSFEKWDRPRYPSITLGYLAASLEQQGISCDIIDAKFEGLTSDDVIDRLRTFTFDIIGLTAMTHDVTMAASLAGRIKEGFSGTTIVLGGVHASALPDATLKAFPQFDFCIVGEGERTFPELIQAIRNRTPLAPIEGLVFREGDQIVTNASRPVTEDLDSIPFPAWEKFPAAAEYHIISARGCPYQCIFCMSPYGRRVRERSPENTLAEVSRVIKTHKPEILRFNDETFGYNRKRANIILDGIIERGLCGTPKHASMRADRVDADILTKMKMAGFVYVDYGVESGNAETLKTIRKGVTLEQTGEAIRITRKCGLRVGVNIIIGHPNETRATAKQTIDYAVRLNADITAIGVMVPYPGTVVAQMAARGEGGYKLLSTNWNDYNKQLGNALELTTLSRGEMERIQAFGYLKIYAFNGRWRELIGFVWTYRKAGLRFIRRLFSGEK